MKTSTKAITILSILLLVSIVVLILKYTDKPEVITTVEYIEVAYKDTTEYNELIQAYDSLGNVIYELQQLKPPVHTVYIDKPIYIKGKDSLVYVDSLLCNVINTYQDTLTDSNSVEIYNITTLGYLMGFQRDLKINYPIVTNTIVDDKRFYEKGWFWSCLSFAGGFYLGSR